MPYVNSTTIKYTICMILAFIIFTPIILTALQKRKENQPYAFRDITLAVEEKDYLILYSGERKIAKVSKDLKNFELLQSRLKAEAAD